MCTFVFYLFMAWLSYNDKGKMILPVYHMLQIIAFQVTVVNMSILSREILLLVHNLNFI